MSTTKKDVGVVLHKDRATFRVWAPFARAVDMTGAFNGWGRSPMLSEGDGYWVAEDECHPVDVTPVGDLLERHRERGVELRVLESLLALRDEVVLSGYRFSMARMANAAAST